MWQSLNCINWTEINFVNFQFNWNSNINANCVMKEHHQNCEHKQSNRVTCNRICLEILNSIGMMININYNYSSYTVYLQTKYTHAAWPVAPWNTCTHFLVFLLCTFVYCMGVRSPKSRCPWFLNNVLEESRSWKKSGSDRGQFSSHIKFDD